MKKLTKRLLSIVLSLITILSSQSVALASTTSVNSGDDLYSAYERVTEYIESNNIPAEISYKTFAAEFETSGYTDINEYVKAYYDILQANKVNARTGIISKWYYNTGTSLPQAADYSTYNLLNTVQAGDIIYESKGGFGITGHIAIVEGIYYSSTYNQYYIRVIEAISSGVCRGVLDDERIDDKGVSILRVSSASTSQKTAAVSFCKSQLGKSYLIDFGKDTSSDESNWYCSELVWAAYYNQGIDIETSGWYNEPGITPRDINNSSAVTSISFK